MSGNVSAPWLVRASANEQASVRLLCFPHSGAGASVYRPWAKAIAPDVELWAVQLPGREERRREPPVTSRAALADDIAAALTALGRSTFAFFGHSMGALLAFEVARRLRGDDRINVLHLFVSGRRAPQVPITNPLYRLSDEALIGVLKRIGGVPDMIWQEPELIDIFLPVIRADLAVNEAEAYRPDDKLQCSISAFGGIDDPLTSEAGLSGWADQTRGEFKCRVFPGGHFYLRGVQDSLLGEMCATIRLLAAGDRDAGKIAGLAGQGAGAT